MEPKDLKNSNDELKVTPEDNRVTPMHLENQTSDVETKKIQEPESEQEGFSSDEENKTVDDEFLAEQVVNEQVEPNEGEEEVIPEQGSVSVKDDFVAENIVADQEESVSIQNISESVQEVPVLEEPAAEQERVIAEQEEPVSGEEQEDQEDQSINLGAEDELDEEKASVMITKEKTDYSEYSEVELINALRELIAESKEEDIKDEIERIKINFYQKHRENIEEEKRKFLEEGGVESEFTSGNLFYEEDLKNLLKDYRQLRNDQVKLMEEEKDQNLQIKYEIIEEIKSLVNRKESINRTFQEFRELQQRWRDTGPVPQSKLKDLWETYHHHVENFYDYIKINKELRDLDLKKNMELKIDLCEKAEELLQEPSIIKAFSILQKYHEQWREIGPVPHEKKEELWERFKTVTATLNKKQQEYFESRREEQKKNLEAKAVLCEKAERIASMELQTYKDWENKSRELVELQKIWRTIGFIPRKENNKAYERFRSACDQFFEAKREFYAQTKEVQVNNLQMKIDLCIQAEAIKDSTDWKKTTEDFIQIQKRWKETGPVPRKQSETIWKRFRTACDYFFDQKSRHFSVVDHEQDRNLELKRALIEEVKNYQLTRNENVDLERMREFQRRWTEIGHVPFRDKDRIQNEFRDAINTHFDRLKIDDQKRNLLKFRNKISNISITGRGMNQVRFQRDKYVIKLKQMENDLALLNNNIGFFANTKNAESLIDDVNRKIQSTQEKIEFLREKIRIIDDMEDED
ncbi:MAG: DUF349 domain-containing protein [Mangrovibacterium sp.]